MVRAKVIAATAGAFAGSVVATVAVISPEAAVEVDRIITAVIAAATAFAAGYMKLETRDTGMSPTASDGEGE